MKLWEILRWLEFKKKIKGHCLTGDCIVLTGDNIKRGFWEVVSSSQRWDNGGASDVFAWTNEYTQKFSGEDQLPLDSQERMYSRIELLSLLTKKLQKRYR